MQKNLLRLSVLFTLLACFCFCAQAMQCTPTTISDAINDIYPFAHKELFEKNVTKLLENKETRANFIEKESNKEAVAWAFMISTGQNNLAVAKILLKYENFRDACVSHRQRRSINWALQDASNFGYTDIVIFLLKKLDYKPKELQLALKTAAKNIKPILETRIKELENK